MKSTGTYVWAVVAVTLVFFGALLAQSLGGFRLVSSFFIRPAPRAIVARDRGSPAPAVPRERSAGAVDSRAQARASSGAAMMAQDYDQVAKLAEENRRLRSANQVLEQRLTSVLNWILGNFRGKFPLPESLMTRVNIPPMTDEFLLNPELAEVLKVTEPEEEQLNDAFAFAQSYLREIETALLNVTNPRPGKVILHIPAFPEDGKLLQEDLYGALEATLGQSRFARFLKVSEGELKESFYHFGEASRTMVFELAYVGDDPQPQLVVKDGYVVEIGSNSRSVTAVESVVTNLPAKYTAYVAWLPDYISDYATD